MIGSFNEVLYVVSYCLYSSSSLVLMLFLEADDASSRSKCEDFVEIPHTQILHAYHTPLPFNMGSCSNLFNAFLGSTTVTSIPPSSLLSRWITTDPLTNRGLGP